MALLEATRRRTSAAVDGLGSQLVFYVRVISWLPAR